MNEALAPLYQRAAQFLRAHQCICIASHIHPDGDAIGSTLALGLGLVALGKKVICYNGDGVPLGLRFLPHSERIVKHLSEVDRIDALVLVDCARPKRAGEVIEQLAQRHAPFLIDHHILPDIDHAQHCIDAQAAATGEVVFHILRSLGVTPDPNIASLIYTTIVTDTGRFRYSSTNAAVFRLAAQLVEYGADPWCVASSLEEQQHPASLALLQRFLETLELTDGGRVAWVTLSQEMLYEAEALPEYAEEFVNFPRSIAGVEVAVLCRELPDGRWKVSLRSKQYVDVAAITARFDGGGHAHAAGCTLACGLAEARRQIGEYVREALRRHAPH